MPYHRICAAVSILAAAAGTTGCAPGLKGAYGAQEFLRVSDTHGLPTYKAAGGSDSDFLDVIKTACPDGDPQIVDGSTGVSYSMTTSRSWYTVYFTCDHEIDIPPTAP